MSAISLTEEQLGQARRQALLARLRRFMVFTITYGLMSLLGFFFMFPIIFMIVAALKPENRVIADLATTQAFLPDPNNLTLDSIQEVFDRVPFERFFFNSVLLTLVTVIVGLFVNSMAAYVLARMHWFGRGIVLGIVVSLIIIPLEAIAVPLMMQTNDMHAALNWILSATLIILTLLLWAIVWNATGKMLYDWNSDLSPPIPYLIQGVTALLVALPLEYLTYAVIDQSIAGGSWLNTYHVMILPFVAEPFSIFLFYQFFINIPRDFDEAAYVDGANQFRIYWQVIVPLSRPVFATVAILKFLQFWSFYLWPLMVVREEKFRPLMNGIDFFHTQEPINWAAIMGYAAMVTVPVLVIFLLFQKWFVASVSSSGVKG